MAVTYIICTSSSGCSQLLRLRIDDKFGMAHNKDGFGLGQSNVSMPVPAGLDVQFGDPCHRLHCTHACTHARRKTRIAMICKEPTSDEDLGRYHMRAGNLVDNLASTIGADKAYRTTHDLYTYSTCIRYLGPGAQRRGDLMQRAKGISLLSTALWGLPLVKYLMDTYLPTQNS
jgi:hypothetical protein